MIWFYKYRIYDMKHRLVSTVPLSHWAFALFFLVCFVAYNAECYFGLPFVACQKLCVTRESQWIYQRLVFVPFFSLVLLFFIILIPVFKESYGIS